VRLEFARPLPDLDGDRSTLIFRVAQEALSNIVRHAHARRVDISLRQLSTRLQLQVRDDGRGCDTRVALEKGSVGQSSGIGGMRDRVRLFSGQFEVESQPGAGFCISIEFPLASNQGASTRAGIA